MAEYILFIIGIVGGLEFLFSLLWDNYDEIYKLKNINLVELKRAEHFIIKHIRRKIYYNKDYEKWALSRQEFNKTHVAKSVIVGQILIHIFCLYFIVAGIVVLTNFDKNLFNYFITYPFFALGIINIILSIVSAIIVDININKIFPQDKIKKDKD